MSNHAVSLTILGCGASAGVPIPGCECDTCTSPNPKDKRSRVSVLFQQADTRLLIDTSPDLRQQLLQSNISKVDGVLYTHDHADHTHGIDDVRSLNYNTQGVIPAYGDAHTLESLQERFSYAFAPPIEKYGWFRPALRAELLEGPDFMPFTIGGMRVQPFGQEHGRHPTLGMRVGDIAYSTDVKTFPENSHKYLEGLDIWVVDCLRRDPAPTHAHLDLTLEWIAHFKPRLAILTHMSHDLAYDELMASLPGGVVPAYDGMYVQEGMSL